MTTTSTTVGLLSPRQPGRYDAGDNQRSLHTGAMEDFKQRLRARHPAALTGNLLGACGALYSPYGPQDDTLFDNHHSGHVEAVSYQEQPAFPLSLFDVSDTLPSELELSTAFDEFVARFQSSLPFWTPLPVHSRSAVRRDVFLAAAAFGCISIQRAKYRDIWSIAARVLMAHTFMDNRLSRSKDSVLTWLLLETSSTLSSQAKVWRQSDGYLGFLYTIARAALMSTPTDLNENWTSESQTSLVLALLLSNTVRSLHLGVGCLAFRCFGCVPLDAPCGTIEDLVLTLVYGEANSSWPAPSDRSALLTMLVLLNQTLLWAKDYLAVVTGRPDGPIASNAENFAGPSWNLHFASSEMHSKLSRGLTRWEEIYIELADKPLRALFHYCNLLLLFPELDMLPDISGYQPRHEYWERSAADGPKFPPQSTSCNVQASAQAWSILDLVVHCSGYCPIWLPSVTHLAGLFVWYYVKSQRQSKIYGSFQVLNVFRQALEQMSWPCCEAMAAHLGSLSEGS